MQLSPSVDEYRALPRDKSELAHDIIHEKGLARSRISAQYEDLRIQMKKPLLDERRRFCLIGSQRNKIRHTVSISYPISKRKHSFSVFGVF